MKGKKIILAVTGSIAAYKAVFLLRLFRKAGADVKVIMTASATLFVKPLTFSVLSHHTVDIDIANASEWNNHVELGLWADVMVVAPCTANTLAKMAHGMADNAVLATYLSSRCPVYVSPAMDLDMYQHPTTNENIRKLKQHGVHIIPVDHGELASGLVGDGRMAEPENIFELIKLAFASNAQKDLAQKTVLITAGPTQEALDPVRYIGNHSTGKMGLALAEVCAAKGADVHLVLGPTSLSVESERIKVYDVVSAKEMLEISEKIFSQSDIAIMAAAVADYRPEEIADIKIKKQTNDLLVLKLVETTDIAKTLGQTKKDDQILIGFALETNNELNNASLKLKKKNLDFIVLNSLRDQGAGFGHDTNKITIVHKDNSQVGYALKSKKEVAGDIVNEIIKLTK